MKMKYEIERTTRFKREYRMALRRGQNVDRLRKIIFLLANGEKLPLECKDHALAGSFTGCRECHIAPDWLLIYQIAEKELVLLLLRTGTHSDLFE